MKTITMTIFALLLLAACAQTGQTEAKPYKFGAVASLTGTQAFYGAFT